MTTSTPHTTQTTAEPAPALLLQPPAFPRPKGKIANLPRHQRDLINQMLDDGKTYAAVAAEMAKHGVSLNGENISNWYQHGHQAWLQHHDWLARIALLRENSSDLPDPASLHPHQAILQVAALQIFESLKTDQLKNDPTNNIRQINALSRLARTAAHLKKITDAEAILAEQNRPLSDEEIREMILDKADDILGCKSYRRKPNEPRTPPLDPPKPDTSALAAPKSPEGSHGAIVPIPPLTQEVPLTTHAAESPQPSTDPLIQQSNNPLFHHSSIPPFQPSTPPSTRIRENCPRCYTLLPPRLATGERSTHCERCGSPLHPPGVPIEECAHCGEIVPDLLPDGQRPHPDCPHCKQPLPPLPPLPNPTP